MKLARIVVVLLTIASLAIVTRLRLSSDLTELFPHSREADVLARVTRVFGGGDVGLVLVRGDDRDDVAAAADASAEALRKVPSIAEVITSPPPAPKEVDPTSVWRWAGPKARDALARAVTAEGMRERLRETRALLLAPGASEVAARIEKDPLRLAMIPWEQSLEVAAGAHAMPGEPFSANGGRARLVILEPRGRAFVSEEAARFTDESESALAAVRAAHPRVKIELTGGHVIARQTEAMIRGDLQRSGVISVVLASLLFVVTFRRARALIALLPPLAAGTLWTTAIACLIYPRLSAIATAFAAVVIGVGVDTGVHVYGHLLAARRDGLDPDHAAARALRETWRPTLGAAIAAGGAFACLALSDIEGMVQLGVLCGLGEVLTAIAILIVVPEIGARLEKGPPPPPRSSDWIAALTRTRRRAGVALVLSGAAIVAAIALGMPKANASVAQLDAHTLPALAVYDAIDKEFGGEKGQLLVVSEDTDPERARAGADAVAEAAETLASGGAIAGFDALGSVAPSLAAQRARLIARDALDLPGRRAVLAKALADEGFAEGAFGAALESFAHPSTETSELGPEGKAGWLVRRHVASDDRGTMAVTYVRLRGDPTADAEARAVLRAADPSAVLTGFPALDVTLARSLDRDMPRVLLAALGVVVMVLGASLRRPSRVALAIFVLAVEIALVLVGAKLIGARWHVYDALVLPVLLGITLDEALFLIEATERGGSIEDALAEQGPLGTATALTTAAGFAALVACRFPGLVDIGKIGALGSTVGLVAAFVVIPAVLRLFPQRVR